MSANKEQTDGRIIYIHGPGWKVEFQVYHQKDAELGDDYSAMRSLAIERGATGSSETRDPLLLHVAGKIKSLKLLPGSNWASIGSLDLEASLIVCRQEEEWLPQQPPNPQNPPSMAPGVFTCVAAEVLLSDAAGKFNKKPQIEAFFNEILIADDTLRAREFWITSAGFKLGGVIRLPWSEEILGGVFDLVGRGKKDAPRDPNPRHNVEADPLLAHEFGWFRMRIDPTRTTSAEMDKFAAVFARMSDFLAIDSQRSPAWANLEFTGMAAAEAMTWLVGTQDESRPRIFRRHDHLNLEPGALRLRLSDQHPAPAPGALLGPLTAATATFGWTVIKGDETTGKPAQLELSFEQDEQADLDKRWPATLLEYLATGSAASGIAESFSLGQLNQKPVFPPGDSPAAKSPAILYLDPVEAPALIREAWGMPEPLDEEKDPGVKGSPRMVKRDPVIWAFMPLADGWAQLPLPNLSERLFRDHFRTTATPTAATAEEAAPVTDALLEGALSLGIHRPELLAKRPDRQPWSLNLEDAAGLKGKWILSLSATQPATLAKAWVAFREPRLTLLGALWLGTKAPSAADAISDHDFWSSSAVPLALFTHRAFTTHLPALLSVAIADFLTAKSMGSGPEEAGIAFPGLAPATLTFQRQREHWAVWKQVLDQAPFMGFEPVLWQHDPRLPHVQNLPLTQTLSPPAYPSPSRQLLPRKLPVATSQVTFYGELHDRFENWSFTLGLDAREWPGFKQPAAAIAPLPFVSDDLADLSAASLLLPGVQQDLRHVATQWTAIVTPEDYRPAHPLTLRHDLPYCDELHALARLPKKKSASIDLEVAMLQDAQEPPVLAPPTFMAHWQDLNELAILAAADGVTAIAARKITSTPGTGMALQWIYADLPWTTPASIAWPAASGHERDSFLPILRFDAGPLQLAGESALEGLTASFNIVEIEGSMALKFTAADGDLHLLAGSMSARSVPGAGAGDTLLADQRGLLRAATGRPAAGDHLLRTPLNAPQATPPLAQKTTALITTRNPLTLAAPAGEFSWRCFFRDLPCDANGKFSRTGIGYAPLTVNDEDAMTRDRNHLRGYEWRLAPEVAPAIVPAATQEPQPPLTLPAPSLDFFGLLFLPLQLVEYSPTRLVILGRLQLPLAPEKDMPTRVVEQPQLRNVIQITFSSTTGRAYELVAVDVVSGQGIEWPLALEREEVTMKPRLLAQKVLLSQVTGANPKRLRLEGLTLAFREFAADWSVSLGSAELVPQTGLPPGSAFKPASITLQQDSDSLPGDALRASKVLVTLDPAKGIHEATLELQLRLGTDTMSAAPPLDFTLGYDLMQPRRSGDGILQGVTLLSASTFKAACKIGKPKDGTTVIEATDRSLAISWKGLEKEISLIDGMPLLLEKCSGAGTCYFSVAEAKTKAGFRSFGLLAGHVEVLLAAREGTSLFGDLNAAGQWPMKADDLHHLPCHAVLDAAFVSTFTPGEGSTKGTWGRGRFLFCGLLECHNLISWPSEWMTGSAGEETVKLPAITAPRDHARHSIRCFLNQHDLATAFGPGRDGETMLGISSAARILCPVEHQVLLLKRDGDVYKATKARRWTTVQEVRLLKPADFSKTLQDLDERRTHSHRVSDGLRKIQDCCDGYFRKGLKEELVKRLDTLQKSLVLEAGTTAWLGSRATPPAELALTDLLILPSGEAEAAVSLPDAFVRKPDEPEDFWLLLQMPFLGRLSKAGTADCEWPDPLEQLDTKLARWMAHRTEQNAGLTITLALHDLPHRRKLPALDSLMLLRNQERAAMRLPFVRRDLPSVIEAVPSEAASYGDPLALQRRFAPNHAQAGKILSVSDPAAGGAGGALTWLRAALMVFQARYETGAHTRPEHGWIASGIHLLRGGLFSEPDAAKPLDLAHHAAATIVFPGALAPDPAQRPLALVTSPYAKLNIRLIQEPTAGSPPAVREVLGRHLELIAIDPLSGQLGVIATRFLTLKPAASQVDPVTAMKTWGDGMLRRMAPESPVGLVRAREVTVGRKADGRSRVPAEERVVSLQYRFLPLTARPPALQQPVFALRPDAVELVFREAHFGGITLPAHAPEDDFELAPPLVCEALPIRISNPQPPESEKPSREREVYDRWPYGYSAYRMDVQFAHAGISATTPAAGKNATDFKFRIWWQSLQQDVEYRPSTHPDGGSDLPDDFRAEPIDALSPLLPSASPPRVGKEPLYLSEPDWQGFEQTQAVLPGATRTLMINSRPGVIYSLRHILFTQTSFESGDDASFIASSVPFQARFPRPVAIPPNRETPSSKPREGFCQQAWPSYYESSINPGRGKDAKTEPFDEASILPLRRGTDIFTGRATVVLSAPSAGLIDPDWNGCLSFQFGTGTDKGWRFTISFVSAQGEVLWDSLTDADGKRWLKGVKNSGDSQRIVTDATERERLKESMAVARRRGIAVYAVLRCFPPGTFDTDASHPRPPRVDDGDNLPFSSVLLYHQELRFRLEIGDSQLLPLPLRPRFFRFEDPAYNEKLESPTVTRRMAFRTTTQKMEYSLTVDRSHYNPTSTLYLKFHIAREKDQKLYQAIEFVRRDRAGMLTPLRLRSEFGSDVASPWQTLLENKLYALPLTALVGLNALPHEEQALLRPDDVLVIKLLVKEKEDGNFEPLTTLEAFIVESPVLPAPESAYALLALKGSEGAPPCVECVRFAWAPQPQRIELVNPADLDSGFVRRRAVYQWTDSCRAARSPYYFLQKIAPNGATHFIASYVAPETA